MSILGRTGGDSGSSSNKAFSDGFAWANLDVPAPGSAEEASRRSLLETEESAVNCDLSVAAKLISKIYVTCGVLITVALLRGIVKGLYVWKFPSDPHPPDLTFPAWEVRHYFKEDYFQKCVLKALHVLGADLDGIAAGSSVYHDAGGDLRSCLKIDGVRLFEMGCTWDCCSVAADRLFAARILQDQETR